MRLVNVPVSFIIVPDDSFFDLYSLSYNEKIHDATSCGIFHNSDQASLSFFLRSLRISNTLERVREILELESFARTNSTAKNSSFFSFFFNTRSTENGRNGQFITLDSKQ